MKPAVISKLPPRTKTILDTKVSAPALHHGMASAVKRPASVGVADEFDDGPMDASCVMINLANDKPRESHQGVMYFPSLNVAASLRGILGAGINFHPI